MNADDQARLEGRYLRDARFSQLVDVLARRRLARLGSPEGSPDGADRLSIMRDALATAQDLENLGLVVGVEPMVHGHGDVIDALIRSANG